MILRRTAIRFRYDGADLIQETDNAGTLQATYTFGPEVDEPLRMVRGALTSYYHQDALGSVIALSNSAGTISETYKYDAFGTVQTPSALGNRFLFTAREFDQQTSLYYYRARYYSPSLGRFLSRDPLSYLPDANLYRYVNNNPVNFIDPLGFTLTGGSIGPTILHHPAPDIVPLPRDSWPEPLPGPQRDMWPEPQIGSTDKPQGCPPHSTGQQPPRLYDPAGNESEDTSAEDRARELGLKGHENPQAPPGPGFIWKGNGQPGSGQGAWVNEGSGETIHIDINHPVPKPPHIGYRGPGGKYDVTSDGRVHPGGSKWW